jgi:hypothetical protein
MAGGPATSARPLLVYRVCVSCVCIVCVTPCAARTCLRCPPYPALPLSLPTRWTLGVLMYVLLTARQPFTSPKTQDPMEVAPPHERRLACEWACAPAHSR